MGRAAGQLLVGLKFALLEQARNRFALGLLLAYLPVWYALLGAMVPADPVAFRLRATGAPVRVNGHDLTLISAGANALTTVVGFLFFTTMRRGLVFGKRLVLAGFSRAGLLLAQTGLLLVSSLLIAAYATAVLLLFWRTPRHPAVVLLGLALLALLYGGLGLLLGVALRGELEGFFLIVMVSLMDTFLQNPIDNPIGNKPFLKYFPAFGPTQIAVAGGFTDRVPWRYVGLSLAWAVAFAGLGLLAFWVRTRGLRRPADPTA